MYRHVTTVQTSTNVETPYMVSLRQDEAMTGEKKLYKKRYRVQSTRLRDWDYSSDGYYFITICVKNKECLFGDIVNTQIELSAIGAIAKEYLTAIPKHFQNAIVDEYVVMPNHVHAIISIENNDRKNTSGCGDTMSGRDTIYGVSTTATTPRANEFSKHFPGSLSVIVQQCKASVKRWCSKNGYPDFQWQRLYYEHIIGTEEELHNVRVYVVNNVMKWELDEYNPAKRM
jgi:REP element-mobilizing transposase RayT